MRLAAICIASFTLAAGGALAQAPGGIPPLGAGMPQAPIGHRQPTANDVPPDLTNKDAVPDITPRDATPDVTSKKGQSSPRAARSRERSVSAGGGPPTLQVGPSCEAAGRGAVVLGRNKEACLADETTAQDTLKQNWSKYSAGDKTLCVGMAKTGGPASYVELLSCLEINRDARNIQNGDPLESDTPSTTPARGGQRDLRASGRRRRS
jgi:hypothetical protein